MPQSHGWPSFRDAEVIWDDVRVLPDGEAVSVAGTHLGHNLPDRKVRAGRWQATDPTPCLPDRKVRPRS